MQSYFTIFFKNDNSIIIVRRIKGNLKKETESILIAVQNNASRTRDFKAKKDKTKYSKCRLSGDKKEKINLIINECSRLAQKEYKT